MKCLNCGRENEDYLCDTCKTRDVLDKTFNDIRYYKPETCENPYLEEYVNGLENRYTLWDIIPEILDYFDFEISEYYYVEYFRIRKDSRYEKAAIDYLNVHDLNSELTQKVLYGLLNYYIPNDFIKPKRWCDKIASREDLTADLYATAAKYYGMIGEYDLSEQITDQTLDKCKKGYDGLFLFYSPENMIARLEKQKEDILRYRTKKPYWPSTEERRRAVAMFYDERGIKYPRIEKKPEKIRESEFAPLNECFEDELKDYCAFWCDEAFSLSAAKCIYRIAAVKVSDGNETDGFESFIRPWDAGSVAREKAAKEAGVSVDIIEAADDVDIVMPKFFSFVGNAVLASTGALGNQAKLISRAARYAGMQKIENEFYDILDLAADTSPEFDLANNTREYLLGYFEIQEGKSALDKASINVKLYDLLKDMEN